MLDSAASPLERVRTPSSAAYLTPFRGHPYRLVMALIFVGAAVAGYVMLPGDAERIAMLERDGHSREALDILEHRYASGERSYRTLYQMQGLYEEQGAINKARQLLDEMVTQRPADPGLRRRQAAFFRATQNLEGELGALEAEIDIKYSETACRDLVTKLRLLGDYTREQAALQKCRQRGYRRPEDLSRLADLYAADGDSTQAISILRAIDDVRRLRSARERYQLLTLLVAQEQPNEAGRRALRWIRAAKDDEQAVGLIDVLARSNAPNVALDVAKDAGIPGDSVSLTIAERLLERGQKQPAQLYLRGWLEKAVTADEETAVRFVETALIAEDPAVAETAARKFGVALLPASLLDIVIAARGLPPEEAAALRALGRSQAAAPSLPAPQDVPMPAEPGQGGAQGQALGQTSPLPGAAPAGRGTGNVPPRRGAVLDPLESWRKGLINRMADDAARRRQALAVGPPPPLPLGRPGHHAGRLEVRGGAKFLKKTSRVLQRTSRNRALKIRQHRREPKPVLPAADPP